MILVSCLFCSTKNMPFALAAGAFGTKCTVKECRATDLARQLLPLPQRETHTV
jgi:hypothetical protein